MNEIEFTQLVKTYNKLIFTVCHRFVNDYQEAENLTQDTFLTAYKVIDNFIGDNHKAWLVKIATNKCKDFLKSSYVKTTSVVEDEIFKQMKDDKTIEVEIESQEQIILVKNACISLGDPYEQIALLYFIEEIATELDIPLKTVQTRYYRARDKLRVLLKEALCDA